MSQRIQVRTHEREEMVDITRAVREKVRAAGVEHGVVHLWSLHTTCGITVNEGADPDVQRDIVTALRRLVPRDGDYRHAEGNDDSHLKTLFAGPGETLLVEKGDLVLGTWQKVFLAEWDGPRSRTIAVAVVGTGLRSEI
ncbi:MAG: secondary thiamine-phosphate synthase enzyme YjbQ, partial [Gemmatimonadota bacterium]